MKSNSSQPVVKIKLTLFDWLTELIALIFLILLIALPIIYINDLPETIPIHFNASGSPDDFGSKSMLWILPVAALFIYLLMTVLQIFPQIYNFPVRITQENASVQYKLASRLLRLLKAVFLIIFSYISYQLIKIALGIGGGLGKAFLPVALLITFGVIIAYIVQSLNNR